MDIQETLSLTYDEYVNYLLNKYGPAKYSYFCNENCKSANKKISRTSEGLFCHHIKENKEILLSRPEVARNHPFEYQMPQNLVYADYLEHLMLHIKIVEEDDDDRGVGLGGVIMISSILNDFYRHRKTEGWKKQALLKIKNNFADYIVAMRYFYGMMNITSPIADMVRAPVLAQGWYERINTKVHKEIYGFDYHGDIDWSNKNVLTYLEEKHSQT